MSAAWRTACNSISVRAIRLATTCSSSRRYTTRDEETLIIVDCEHPFEPDRGDLCVTKSTLTCSCRKPQKSSKKRCDLRAAVAFPSKCHGGQNCWVFRVRKKTLSFRRGPESSSREGPLRLYGAFPPEISLHVAREALAIATKVLRVLYTHKYSPKLYTQPQLELSAWSSRSSSRPITAASTTLCGEHTELRRTVGILGVPHYTTLHKASKRACCGCHARRLLVATIRRHLGRRRSGPS